VKSARTLVISSLLLLASCGGGKNKGDEAPKSESEKSESRRERANDDPSSEGRSWGGWRWKGRRENCFFVMDNRCFSTLKGACSAAKCRRRKDCKHDGSAPAKVSCDED